MLLSSQDYDISPNQLVSYKQYTFTHKWSLLKVVHLFQNKRDLHVLLHKIIIGKHILQTVRDEWACSSKYVLDEENVHVSPALYDDYGLLRDH